MKKEIEAFVNAANEQELEAAWNNLSAEEQRVFEQLMEEDSPEDALAFFAQLYDDAPKEQASETVSISENEIYFKRQPRKTKQRPRSANHRCVDFRCQQETDGAGPDQHHIDRQEPPRTNQRGNWRAQ